MSDTPQDHPRVLTTQWWLGTACLIGASVFSGLLVLKRLGLIDQSLPGCGPESACDQITNGPFGSIPWLQWPVSFVGLAWFLGLLLVWILGRGGLSSAGRWLIRAGALGSLCFVLIMVAKGAICPYCLGAHLCNFGFWLCVEIGRRTVVVGTVPNWGVGFAVVTLILAGGKMMNSSIQQEKAERAEDEMVKKIIANSTPAQSDSSTTSLQEQKGVQGNSDGSVVEQGRNTSGLLQGRWRMGPADAPVQVVMFSDYGCPDCRSYEAQMQRILDQRDDVSLVVKHFPMSTDCNPNLRTNMHANACWAARAAETAGILGGEDAFWEWHDWLFFHEGKFANGQLPQLVEDMGFDRREFTQIMTSDETLIPVQEDIADGSELGLFFTPMIFINGVELKWWAIPSRLEPAVNRVADAIAAGSAEAQVRPPLVGIERYIDDWQGNRRMNVPARSLDLVRRSEDDSAPQVTLFTDFTSQGTSEVLGGIRAWEVEHGPLTLDLRMYPFDKNCNPSLPARIKDRPGACLGARAYLAAGVIGGPEGAAAIADWIFDQGPALGLQEITEPDIVAEVSNLGMDPANFRDAMYGQEVNRLLQEDLQAYKRIGARRVPTLFIDGREAPRFMAEGNNIVVELLNEAAKERR